MQESAEQTFSFGRGATILMEGMEDGEFCYLILSGRVEIFRMVDGAKTKLGEMGEGGVIGEMALIDPAPRAASVVAIEPTACRRINAATLEKALAQSPPLARYLLQTFIRNIRHANGSPVAAAMPASVASADLMAATIKSEHRAMRVLDRRPYASGEAIFRSGQPGHSLYLVQSGRIDLVRDRADGTVEKLRSIGPGEVFGELSLLTGGLRRASAIAAEISVCESISAAHFSTIVNACPAVVRALMRIYADMMQRHAMPAAVKS